VKISLYEQPRPLTVNNALKAGQEENLVLVLGACGIDNIYLA
jgi:hypothetical protein